MRLNRVIYAAVLCTINGVFPAIAHSAEYATQDPPRVPGAVPANTNLTAKQAPPPVLRRITEEQYKNSIADIFGPQVRVPGRFQQEIRRDGMLAVGTGLMSVTPAGFEQYDLAARSIAEQVVDATERASLVPCRPANPKKADDPCASRVFSKYGRLIYRRPLEVKELDRTVSLAHEAANKMGDFYSGIAFGLANLLVSPDFLFITDLSESSAADAARERFRGFSRASSLSFLLWNSTPDDELLTAAETGKLATPAGLEKQVDRMIASPRFSRGIRAFFSDMLAFDELADLAKDPAIYPEASAQIIKDAREQTLRTIVHHVVELDADYRDLYTTRKTFLSRSLAYIYQEPFVPGVDWRAFEFPADSPRAGLVTQLSFLMLHSHPGRSSATKRGKAVRELLLCQKVPDPPANVNFSVVQDTNNPDYKTARSRLTAHMTDEACASCHKTFDPVGLGLEQFDGSGSFRTQENGVTIDASGALDGTSFTDGASLGRALRNHPQLPTCLVTRAYEYAFARAPARVERSLLAELQTHFTSDGYRVGRLFRQLALMATPSPSLSSPIAIKPEPTASLARSEVSP